VISHDGQYVAGRAVGAQGKLRRSLSSARSDLLLDSAEVVIMMRPEANATETLSSRRTCEADEALSAEGKCRNVGEVLHGGALLCEAHAALLGLEDRAEAVLQRMFRMDEWLEGNGGPSADEEFVGRVRHEREEAVTKLRLMRERIRNARKALQG
jgi:hypothetical protein